MLGSRFVRAVVAVLTFELLMAWDHVPLGPADALGIIIGVAVYVYWPVLRGRRG